MVGLLWGEFGHVLLHIDNTHVWAVLLSNTEEFHNMLVVLDITVNQDEKKFTLEFLGGGGVISHNGVGLGGKEQVVLFQITTEDLWGGFVGELVDKSKLLLLDELDKSIGTLTGEVDTALVELLEKSNLSLGNFESGGGVSIKNTEWNIVEGITGGIESGESITRDETNNGNLVVLLEFASSIGASNIDGWWAGFLGYPADNLGLFTSAFVVHWVLAITTFEPFECWVSTDAELLCQITVNSSINLNQKSLGTVLLELLGGFFVLWGK